MEPCPKCKNQSVRIAEDEPKCIACGWDGFKGMNADKARKEVEREARKIKYMRAKKRGYIY